MKKLSLKWKVYIIGLVPFSFFLFNMFLSLHQEYSSLSEAKSLSNKMEVIQAASAVVHETQKERGKTAGYLNGGVTIASLNEQRAVNNKKRDILRQVVLTSTLSKSYKDSLLLELDKYKELREKVSTKEIPLGKALKSYTGIIKKFLALELDVANATTLPAIAAKLKGLRILEDAKESGGKLRANMTGILAKSKPITDKKFATIVSLKAGIDEGLNSSGLTLDEKSIAYIAQFKTSQEWKTVNDTFKLILKNSDRGNYYQDAAQFFSIITKALNIIGELINHQKAELVVSIDDVKSVAISNLWKKSFMTMTILVGLFFFISSMTGSITKKIREVIRSLSKSSQQISKSSTEVAATSSELSEASNQQASSLQETASSVDEISSMVQRSADSAAHSTASSQKSKEEASQGKENIDQMIRSIGEIAQSNQEIMDEMKVNNEEIGKITSVISQIAEKTNVINDIVFQTKLLSFNASVEAARAGEHGKGFAVVAEEVGNLAAMSGKAALEISEMLESSIQQVHEIVDSSKGKIENLVSQGKDKVDRGTEVAHQCGEALESILQNVNTVNDMVKEISIASSEQAVGIKEITSAMQNLDQFTHQNASSARSSAKMAENLKKNSNELNSSVAELDLLVNGHHTNQKSEEIPESFTQNNLKTEQENIDNLIQIPSPSAFKSVDKVAGSDITPSDNDPRFQDL